MCFCAWAWLLWAGLSGLASDGAPADPAFPLQRGLDFSPGAPGAGDHLLPVHQAVPSQKSSPAHPPRVPKEPQLCDPCWRDRNLFILGQWKCSSSCHIHHAWAALHCCSPCLSRVVQGVISHLFILIQRLWWGLSTPFSIQRGCI